jgi:hypothetical protein
MSCNCKVFEKEYARYWHETPKIASCQEHRSRYEYDNRQRQDYLSLYYVDGGIFPQSDTKKCDYLLINCNKREAFFIELKGSDLIQAVKQIDRTIDLLSERLYPFSINARIVLTRVNTVDLRDTRVLKFERKIQRLCGNLKKQSGGLNDINH